MIQPSVLYVQCITVYCFNILCRFSVIIYQLFGFHSFLFCFFGCSCLIIQCSIIRLLSVIFCPDTVIVFQVFQFPYQQPSSKSINIIHQTVPSFVLVQEARAYYHHRHKWDIRNQFLQISLVEGEIETIGHYERTNICYNPTILWLELQHTIFSFSPKISNTIG